MARPQEGFVGEEGARRLRGGDLAVEKERNGVGYARNEGQVVRCENNRHPLAGKLYDLAAHLQPCLRIEALGRLVEQQKVGLGEREFG